MRSIVLLAMALVPAAAPLAGQQSSRLPVGGRIWFADRTWDLFVEAQSLDVDGGLTVPARSGTRVVSFAELATFEPRTVECRNFLGGIAPTVTSFVWTTMSGAGGTSTTAITVTFVAETIDRRTGERQPRTFDVVDCRGPQPRLLVRRIEFNHDADNTPARPRRLPAPRRPPSASTR
jgi:hypothetical protein